MYSLDAHDVVRSGFDENLGFPYRGSLPEKVCRYICIYTHTHTCFLCTCESHFGGRLGGIFSQRAPEALPGKDGVFWLLYGPEAVA